MLKSEYEDHVELSIGTLSDNRNNHGGIRRKLIMLLRLPGVSSRLVVDDCGSIWNKINKIVEISCVIAVVLDPLFFYIPYIDEENKCLGTDKKLRIASLLLRSLTDISFIFSIACQIREWILWKIDPSHGVRSRGYAVTRTKKKIARNMSWLSLSVFIDFLAVLPIPQVLIVVVFFKTKGFAYSHGTIWNFFLLFQYLPRIYRIYLWSTEIAETRGFVIKSAFYFFLYIICSHVLGGFWYFFAIQRETSCWHQACLKHSTCMSTFSCDGNSSRNITSLDELCPIRSPDATQFNFGIFIDSLQSNNKASINFPTKFFFSFWWALRNISSLGSNLETSNYLWENCFAILICVIGLPLFLFLIGNNVQTYMQMNIAKSEDIRQKLRNKRFDIEMWMYANNIPRHLRTRIITLIRRRLEVDRDADLDNLFSILPWDINQSIKSHLLNTLSNEPMLRDADPELLKMMGDFIKPVIYNANNFVVQKGEPLECMLFISRGTIGAYTPVDDNASPKITTGSSSIRVRWLEKNNSYGVEQLLSCAANTNGLFSDLPISTENLKCHTKVEGFVLMAKDLRLIASKRKFSGWNNMTELQRYHKAATIIAVALRRWQIRSKRKIEMFENSPITAN